MMKTSMSKTFCFAELFKIMVIIVLFTSETAYYLKNFGLDSLYNFVTI